MNVLLALNLRFTTASALLPFLLSFIFYFLASSGPAVAQQKASPTTVTTEAVPASQPQEPQFHSLTNWLAGETAAGQALPVTCAYLRKREIRICFTNGPARQVLQAKWKFSRAPAREYAFANATLEAGKLPESAGKPQSRWKEVQVLPQNEFARLLLVSVERLVPKESSHGIYCRHAFGDAVLFRNAEGQVQEYSGEGSPKGIELDRRYSQAELASAMGKALETDFREANPNATSFLATIGTGVKRRVTYVDLAKKQIVILHLPSGSDDFRIGHLGLKLSNLASVILVDHAWAFLKNPFSSSARTVNQWIQWPFTLLKPHLGGNGEAIPPVSHGPGMDLGAWEEWLDHKTHTPREQGSLQLLIDGDRFYPLLEKRISEAQSNVCLHVCIFDRDDVAVDAADLLKKRSTNVEVKVVYDRLITRGAAAAPPGTQMRPGFVQPDSIKAYLREGSKVHVRPQPNPGFTADHTKVFLFDDRYAYVGGMNIGREYRYEWHDLMAEVQGPIIASLQREFDKKWTQMGLWGDCGLAAESLHKKPSATAALGSKNEWIELRRLYTKTFGRQIRKAELAAINRASSYVYAQNPYFFSKDILDALARARLRGVDVRIVMSTENDLSAAHNSSLVVANYFLEHGVRVYFYPGMTHVKAMLVDGWACFGSANFDALSLQLNREADLATSDPVFAEKFKKELFEADFARSRELREPLSVDWSDHLSHALLAPF